MAESMSPLGRAPLVAAFPFSLRKSSRVLTTLGLLLFTAGHPQATKGQSSETYHRTIKQQGIVVDLTVGHLSEDKAASGSYREGDDVVVRFAVSDSSKKSIGGAYPAAWMPGSARAA